MINYQPDAMAESGRPAELPEPIRHALSHANIVDITTRGRRSGLPRRIEIVYHVFEGRIYISGLPRRQKRGWLLNLEADPHFTFHLKNGIEADLAATARVIVDPDERRDVMGRIIATAWHAQALDAMVANSPLIEVRIEGIAA